MSIQVYDLVRTMLMNPKTRYSRNRYFDALTDPEFARAKKVAQLLRSVANETKIADNVDLIFQGEDSVVVEYVLDSQRGQVQRTTTLVIDEWELLLEIAPHLSNVSSNV